MRCALVSLQRVAVAITLATALATPTCGHEHTKGAAERVFLQSKEAALAQANPPAPAAQTPCRLKIDLIDSGDGRSVPGLVRVTDLTTKRPVHLEDAIHRHDNWFTVSAGVSLTVPPVLLEVEAIHGIETERVVERVDLSGQNQAHVELRLPRIYDPHQRQLRSGNTHLHLMRLTPAEAIEYLQQVPRGDGLDLVFLSHLRRVPDERHYVSNQIVLESFQGGSLRRLSGPDLEYGNGQEHRHNFDRYGEGYGHVMFLNIPQLIRPVSLGPGLMGEGTDGIPLQRGIQAARRNGATVVWCHNQFGFEDIPNWLAGTLHAMNIFDGGDHGTYADTFYRYLNIGLEVPFSTGTDWFIYDFARVYVPLDGRLPGEAWLRQLVRGRSYITNSTFLELSVAEAQIGDRIDVPAGTVLPVRARGVGRHDFHKLELIYNGEVVHEAESRPVQGHYRAQLEAEIEATEPGWMALRIAPQGSATELGKPLFAHTSPIYVSVDGQRIFRADVARGLLTEVRAGMQTIEQKAKFADTAEHEAVMQVHHHAIATLEQMLSEAP